MDFYDYVEPSARDETVRAGIISKIERIIGPPRAVLDDACSIKCFGSFPAKLYLPTADMDLVLVSDSYLKGGRSMLDTSHQPSVRRALRAAANKLQRAGMFAEQPTLIFRAKVPIVKFVDRQSRIQVDLSFENLSGVVAQETFRKWTSEIPNMFPLIALIKQFLVMRDLNDVHTGGLGGFSIICLVYTYLRNHLPDPAEGEMVNLAKLFMGFLDFWGNKFDLATQRLETTSDPPRIVQKVNLLAWPPTLSLHLQALWPQMLTVI
jgi:non-canonical poly(A) RNA polymerase PAPD5/7